MAELIRGAKGAAAPVEQSDTLRSTQRVEIVDLLGEGTIGGLVNGLKSVYLDGVPVENADGSRNVADFAHAIRLGGPLDAAPAHGFGDVQTEVGVNTNVTVLLPATRTVNDASVDALRVTLMFQGLMETLDNGDRVGSSVEFAIDVQSNFGGFVERLHTTVSGKASAAYPYAVRLELAQWGPPPWDIRVRRITPDATTQNVLNAFGWLSYTAISGVKMLYRNSAVAWLSFDGANFASVPSRWYDVMGISDWDVPVNYDPRAHTHAGVWNGLFKQDWTSNPAWVLYGLVQNPRYGLGEYVAQVPDKWTLYALAQWCDGMLPDGRGGLEPRYSINAVINTQSEALALLQQICNIFRGVMTHSGSTLATTWDAPATPGALYAPANVKDGLFTYTDGSKGAKKSSCTCWYTDRTQAGKRVPVTWDDPDLIAKYGMRSMEIDPLGVATPAQAMRMAKWALFTNEVEDQTVSFSVGAQGLQTRLGEVFQVSDPSETDERLAGRVSAATTNQVTLDAPVTLAPGETYTLWVTLPDSGDHKRTLVESRTVINAPGTHQVLMLASALPTPPTPQTMWMLEGSNVQPTLWRCVGIAETGGVDGPLEFEITGLKYEPGKWALIEQDQPLTVRPTRRLGNGAPQVASVDLYELVYVDAGVPYISVQASWPMPAAGLRYVVAWRLANGGWTTLAPSAANSVDIKGLAPGPFELQVRSLNALASLSPPTSQTLTLLGYAAKPSNVLGLTQATVPGGVRVAWTANPHPMYAKTRLTYGDNFLDSLFMWEGNSSDAVVKPVADGPITIWAVHLDKLGQQSVLPSSVSFNYVAANTAGVNTAEVLLYQRSAAAPPALTAAVVYTFATGAISGLTSGWEAFIPSGTNPLWVLQGRAIAPFGTPTDSLASDEFVGPVILARDGVPGGFADIRFKRSATPPPAPTGANPVDWLDAPPAADGNPLYMTRANKDAQGALLSVWSTPVRLEGQGVKAQYSVDGAAGWHDVATVLDKWLRISTDGGETWTAPVKFVGEAGAPGANGTRTAIMTMYRWSYTVPTTFPAGQSTYNWAAGTFSTPPIANGWGIISAAPQAGQTLYAVRQVVADNATTPTTDVDWISTNAHAVGLAGTTGLRGSLIGYSTSVTPAIYSTNPWNGADDGNASTVIWRMRGNGGSPPDNSHLVIGDTVTLTNAAVTQAATRYWTGGSWNVTGQVFSADVLVGGTISGQTNLNIAGYAKIEGGAPYSVVDPSSGGTTSLTCAVVANTTTSQQIGLMGYSGGLCGVYGYNSLPGAGRGVIGRGFIGVQGFTNSHIGHAVKGENTSGTAIFGATATGVGIEGSSTSYGAGVYGYSAAGWGGHFNSIRSDGVIEAGGGLKAAGLQSTSGWVFAEASANNFSALHHNGANLYLLGYYSGVQQQHLIGFSDGWTRVNKPDLTNFATSGSPADPITPSGFLRVRINGSDQFIAYYTP